MMMAPEYYVFTGERVPNHVTHVLIAEALNFVRSGAFEEHPNIEVVKCHDGVEKIEEWAFYKCPSLRRVIMPGVKVVAQYAFYFCKALTDIDCGKLEIIEEQAFRLCTSLSSIDLPSIRIVDDSAFNCCYNLVSVKFGNDLESMRLGAFYGCRSLERITLPLKDSVLGYDSISTFQACEKLNHVDLVGGVHETVAALLIEEWKHDMNEEIDTINQILPNTPAGTDLFGDIGVKAQAIRTWITSVLRKIIRYKTEHRRYVNEAAATLQSSLPNDVVLKNVLPFLQLPSDTCEADEDDSEDDNIPLAALRLT